MTVVVERIDPPELFDWFVRAAQRPRDEGGAARPDAGDGRARGRSRDNEVVCLLCDRDIQGGGVEVEFFGERTTLPGRPGDARRCAPGAPILPVGVYFTRAVNGHHAVVRPPLPAERTGTLRDDVARVTQALAHELELLIRRAPEQWHLFQPNWPSDPGYPR